MIVLIVIIAEKIGGDVSRYKTVESIWNVSDDKDTISNLIQSEVAGFLPESWKAVYGLQFTVHSLNRNQNINSQEWSQYTTATLVVAVALLFTVTCLLLIAEGDQIFLRLLHVIESGEFPIWKKKKTLPFRNFEALLYPKNRNILQRLNSPC